jgi:hypothetical protein
LFFVGEAAGVKTAFGVGCCASMVATRQVRRTKCKAKTYDFMKVTPTVSIASLGGSNQRGAATEGRPDKYLFAGDAYPAR